MNSDLERLLPAMSGSSAPRSHRHKAVLSPAALRFEVSGLPLVLRLSKGLGVIRRDLAAVLCRSLPQLAKQSVTRSSGARSTGCPPEVPRCEDQNQVVDPHRN